MTMLKLTITHIREPIGSGPGEVMARNATDQAVKIAITKKDWPMFTDADLDVGDSADYDPKTRAWTRG
jgi:hypothetical protein